MPGAGEAVAVGVDEDDCGGEVGGVVVVDEVGEVGEGFAGFVQVLVGEEVAVGEVVFIGGESGGGGVVESVDVVDCSLPAAGEC